MFRSVLSQFNTRLRLFPLLYDIEAMWSKTIKHAFSILDTLIKHVFLTSASARRVLSINNKLGTHFDVICDLLLNRHTATWNLFVLCDNEQTNTNKAKAGLCTLWRTRKKPFDVIYYLCKMKQCHWFLCLVAWIMVGPGKSRDWWKTCEAKVKNIHYSHIFSNDFYIWTPSSASLLREMLLFSAETTAYVFCMLFEFLPSFKRTIHQFNVYFLSFKFVQTAGITGKVHATSSFPKQRTGIQQKKPVKHSVPSLS